MKTIRSKQKQKSHRLRSASSGDLYSPELWSPDGPIGVLQRLTVIGPYPTEEFFSQMEQYNPREILLVADEGCSREVIDRIYKLCGTRICIRYASCRNCGLLHAKVYLAEWDTGIARKNRLLWGSMNVSRNGFQVNGEVVSAVTLDEDQERAILPYFRQLWEQESGSVQRLNSVLLGRVQFLLPEFLFFPPTLDGPVTFDAWVQAGRLCHKFQRDQMFAKLSVKLLDSLPEGMLENIFTTEGLRADTEMDTIRFSYIRNTLPDSKPTKPRWLSNYFLETWLGYWTSDSCFHVREQEFTATNKEQRERALNRIKQGRECDQQKWCVNFLEHLHRAVRKMEKSGYRPQDYFDMSQNGL